ncbi:MAG: OmpH family outer membrane protein [Endomicrobiales bacterium]|nr:OmpH family outer membrane protein [Endomicrobiales bacterium]
MINFKKYIFIFVILLFCASMSFALTINVDGQTQVLDNSKDADKSAAVSLPKIAYVDMERAFVEHPLSSRSKEEFTVEVEKRKDELLAMENELLKLQSNLVAKEAEIKDAQDKMNLLSTESPVIESTSSLSSIRASTSTASSLSSEKMTELLKSTEEEVKIKQSEYNAISINIEKKRAEIADKNKKNKDELCTLEECKSAEVLKDIFQIINKVAQDEGISMIIDKNDILFAQPYQDITDKVLDRMRGR